MLVWTSAFHTMHPLIEDKGYAMSDLLIETLCIVFLISAPFVLVWWSNRKKKKAKGTDACKSEDGTKSEQ